MKCCNSYTFGKNRLVYILIEEKIRKKFKSRSALIDNILMVIDDPVLTSHTDSTLKNLSSKYGV